MGFTSSRFTCKISIWICSYASYAANTEASKHVQRSRSLLRLKMAQFPTGHDQPPVRAQASSFRYTTHAMVTQISNEHRRSVKIWGDSGPTPLLYSWKSEESRWSWCSGGWEGVQGVAVEVGGGVGVESHRSSTGLLGTTETRAWLSEGTKLRQNVPYNALRCDNGQSNMGGGGVGILLNHAPFSRGGGGRRGVRDNSTIHALEALKAPPPHVLLCHCPSVCPHLPLPPLYFGGFVKHALKIYVWTMR